MENSDKREKRRQYNREWMRAWREQNKDKCNARRRDWLARKSQDPQWRARQKAVGLQWRERNRERLRAKLRQYAKDHREMTRKSGREYYARLIERDLPPELREMRRVLFEFRSRIQLDAKAYAQNCRDAGIKWIRARARDGTASSKVDTSR